jgi:excisionase family DNA binding protein
MMANPPDQLSEKLSYTIAEAARALGIGKSTIYLALASGKLSARKCGSRTLLLADELRRYTSSLPPARPTNSAA